MRALLVITCLLHGINGFGQAHCVDEAFDQQVRKYLNGSIPAMDIEQLAQTKETYVILDAREYEEFATSHIPGALWIGYKKLQLDTLDEIPRDAQIVVYCSIGYRSERVGNKLQNMGYTRVQNLFGSIFEWINRGQPVENADGDLTRTVHGYSKSWSKWILDPTIEKIW